MTIIIMHTLNRDTEGWAVRGALCEMNGRLYGLAGECGPNGSSGCNSGVAWQTIEHTAHCPGTLFSIGMDGSGFHVEHAFSRLDDVTKKNADGYHPYGTLSAGPDGRLYGVTQMGGSPPNRNGESIPGYGVLFAYAPTTGTLEVLHTFFGVDAAQDGWYPMGAVAIDASGSVYGTTKAAGLSGSGTVWQWSPGGAFRYAALPGECYGGVTLAGHLLHGTTWAPGAGVYFTVDNDTLRVEVVASFPTFTANLHGTDNTPIQSPLVLSNGMIVTAREFGGAFGTGIIARLDPMTSSIEVIHDSADIPLSAVPRFSNATGGMLNGQLAEGRDGMIYGTAQYGGANGTGGIYRIARDGSLFELVYSWPDEAYPYGGVTLGSDGALYGVTFVTGQIWRMSLPIG